MPSSYTSLLGLVLPVQGELQGTWGDTVNNELTSLLDTAIAGTTTLSTDADVTLTDTDGASNQARQQIILWTATGTTTRNITAPAQSKTYVVINATGGTQSIVIRGAGPTTGVTIPAGRKALVAWNGSDFEEIAGGLVDLTSDVTGTLPVANGGTGAATFTANNVLLGNGTSAFQVVAPGTSGNVLTSNGTTWASAPAPSSQVYPGAGIAVSTGTAWDTSKTAPSGDIVGTTDTQTLTNKTVEAGSFTNGYTEEVFAVTGTTPALSPTNGSIQTWTLSGNSTPTAGTWASGQSLTLMVDDGTDYTITWTSLSVTWKTDGGAAPTLNTTGETAIQLWKVGTTIYGARVGDA